MNFYRAGDEHVIDSPEMPLELAKIFVDEMKVAKAVESGAASALDEELGGKKPGPSSTK